MLKKLRFAYARLFPDVYFYTNVQISEETGFRAFFRQYGSLMPEENTTYIHIVSGIGNCVTNHNILRRRRIAGGAVRRIF